MRAIRMEGPGAGLVARDVPVPEPSASQLLLKVRACGICRTDLHILDGELPDAAFPLVPGHQVVGEVVGIGETVEEFAEGDLVGVPWLGWTCGECRFCKTGRENLCDRARYTGYDLDGGFAEYTVADARYCFPLPAGYSDAELAPLLCAGLIGYRCLRAAGAAERLGIYGFGAAAHLLCQVAAHEGRRVFAFARPGDEAAMRFARELGAEWAGSSTEQPPVELDAAIIFAPVGALVPTALGAIAKGGTVVAGGIHMSDIPSFPYHLLWGERVLRSVANLTRRDGREFLDLAGRVRLRVEARTRPLDAAAAALEELRAGADPGAIVLVP